MTTDHQIDPRFRDKPYGYHLDINPLYGYQNKLRAVRYTAQNIEQRQHELLTKIDDFLSRLDDPMRVVVAGGFNAGKSTFLNALVNQKVMPVKAVRSTCTVNVLQSGMQRELIIHRRNGRIEQRPYQNDADVQQQIDRLMKTEHASIAKIAVCCPNQRFLERFTLIDTPGLDHNAEDSATSAFEVERADALIWVLHNKGAEKIDYQRIVQFRTAHPASPVVVILNQVDSLEEDELNDALTATQAKLNAHVAAILPLSAKLAGEGLAERNQTKLDASYFYELRSYLQHNLFDQYRDLQERIRFHRCSQSLLVELQQFLNQNTAKLQSKTQQLINGRYHDLGNGTVLDMQTKLQWMRCALGQTWNGKTCVGEAITLNWEDAKKAAKSCRYANYTDWRLPTIEELKSLVIRGQSPTIDQQAFPNTPCSWFWSGSPNASYSSHAWYVSFSSGDTYNRGYDYGYVRLVRVGHLF